MKDVISNHPAYPGQRLQLVTPKPDDRQRAFRCHGCFMYGTCARYRLLQNKGDRTLELDQDHHICCAVGPATQFKLTHTEYGVLEFLCQPPESKSTERRRRRVCRACNDPVNGFVYHSPGNANRTAVLLHPCCAAVQSSADECSHVPPRGNPHRLSFSRLQGLPPAA